MTEEQRRNIIESAKHSSEMEGLPVSKEFDEYSAEYIAGTATSADLIARAKERYGIG